MTISFVNPGEIDMTALSVMGLSVKESDSAIGRFGTGLKYAVAITLRLNGAIKIWSGTEEYDFHYKTINFRGKEVKQVHLSRNGGPLQPLHFTLDYGQDWQPWQAMRELESNCRDESGQSMAGVVQPEEGFTTIWVDCKAIQEAYANLSDYFITGKPLATHNEWEVYHWPKGEPSTKIFYRGVYVGDFEQPSRFCYNFKRGVNLSEDRMIPAWMSPAFPRMLGWVAIECHNREYVETIVTCDGYMETKPEMPSSDYEFAHFFHSVVEDYITEGRANLLNMAYLTYHYKCKKKDELLYTKHDLSARERALLTKVKKVIEDTYPDLPELYIVKDLPNNVIGLCAGGKLYISKRALDMGEGTLLGTILEEYYHWKHGFADETRSFQNFLVDRVATLMLELHFLQETTE